MARTSAAVVVAIAVVVITPTAGRSQVVLNQIDTFQDGTTNNWTNGTPAIDPLNIPNGGPGAIGDAFMEVQTTGAANGPGSRMVVFNRDQWLGNYVAAGVGAIAFDVKNLGGDPLSIRVGFKNDIFLNAPGYVSAVPQVITADGLWHRVVFFLDSSPNGLTPLGGPPALGDFLSTGIAEMRLIHAPTVDLNGANTFPNAQRMGIDNIQALPVPEPSSLALLVLAAAGLGRRRLNRNV